MSKVRFGIIALLFFIFGIASTLLYQRYTTITEASNEVEVVETDGDQIISPTRKPIPTRMVQQDSFRPVSNLTNKYTIVESKHIVAERTLVQTGENVFFNAALKNTGSSKKRLTHICFQHSKGGFGCILNQNIGPGEEFSFSNSTQFEEPGVYHIWITWSQDGTNFYRPLQSTQATVTVE